MTIYRWPSAKVWLITGGSRLERDRWLEEQLAGRAVPLGEFTGALLEAITGGEKLSDFRKPYILPEQLGFSQIQLLDGKPATAEEFSEILWQRHRAGRPSFLGVCAADPEPVVRRARWRDVMLLTLKTDGSISK